MKKIVVLAAVALGALALTFAAVAIPREAAACQLRTLSTAAAAV